jgi:hypothetical protein
MQASVPACVCAMVTCDLALTLVMSAARQQGLIGRLATDNRWLCSVDCGMRCCVDVYRLDVNWWRCSFEGLEPL